MSLPVDVPVSEITYNDTEMELAAGESHYIYISESEPESSQGSEGDIWIVVSQGG